MAIVADLIPSKGPVRLEAGARANAVELPPSGNVQHISAAGTFDLTQDAEVFLFHNLASSQTVSIRLNLDTDNTAASPTDAQSIRIDPGEAFSFGLPLNTDATAYKLSVA